jgi:hypothetical protein
MSSSRKPSKSSDGGEGKHLMMRMSLSMWKM